MCVRVYGARAFARARHAAAAAVSGRVSAAVAPSNGSTEERRGVRALVARARARRVRRPGRARATVSYRAGPLFSSRERLLLSSRSSRDDSVSRARSGSRRFVSRTPDTRSARIGCDAIATSLRARVSETARWRATFANGAVNQQLRRSAQFERRKTTQRRDARRRFFRTESERGPPG